MDTERLTPMLSQYRQIKARFPDAIVLFRLGDFFETFEEDARIAARELELVLTSRSFAKGVRLPMAGVPHHHVQSYIAKLIDRGYKVALVEQLEDPKKTKKLVKRDVIRVITPGTVVEDALLRAKSENYLAAIVDNPHPSPCPLQGVPRQKQGRGHSASPSSISPRVNLPRRRSKARMLKRNCSTSCSAYKPASLCCRPRWLNDDHFVARAESHPIGSSLPDRRSSLPGRIPRDTRCSSTFT